MSSFALIVIWAMAVFAALAVIKKKRRDVNGVGYQHMPGKAPLSPEDQSFLGVLNQTVGPERYVFGKACMADAVTTKWGPSNVARQGALSRIGISRCYLRGATRCLLVLARPRAYSCSRRCYGGHMARWAIRL